TDRPLHAARRPCRRRCAFAGPLPSLLRPRAGEGHRPADRHLARRRPAGVRGPDAEPAPDDPARFLKHSLFTDTPPRRMSTLASSNIPDTEIAAPRSRRSQQVVVTLRGGMYLHKWYGTIRLCRKMRQARPTM